MKVVCPQCNFSSEIPEDKIPENAQLATCPKCQHRFRFRFLDEDPMDIPDVQDSTGEPAKYENHEHHPEAPRQTEDYENAQINGDAPGQPGTGYEHPGKGEDYRDQDESVQQDAAYRSRNEQEKESPAPEKEEGDLWQKLGAMAPKATPHDTDPDYDDEVQGEYFFEDVPFDNPEKYGFFPALGLTVKRVLTKPVQFFKDMPLTGYLKPLIFFLLLAEFQAVFEFFWEILVGLDGTVMQDINTTVGTGVTESLSSGTETAFLNLLLFPLILAFVSFPTAGITHVMLMIFGAGKRGFEATFRATTYPYAAAVFSILPIAGPFITAALSMVLSIIAYKNIHGSSYLRVILAMMAPAVVFLVLAAIYIQLNQPTI